LGDVLLTQNVNKITEMTGKTVNRQVFSGQRNEKRVDAAVTIEINTDNTHGTLTSSVSVIKIQHTS